MPGRSLQEPPARGPAGAGAGAGARSAPAASHDPALRVPDPERPRGWTWIAARRTGASGAAAVTGSVDRLPSACPARAPPSSPADRRRRCGRLPARRPISSAPREPGRCVSPDSHRWRDASRDSCRGDPASWPDPFREASSPPPERNTSGRRRHPLPGEPWNPSPRTACYSCDKRRPSPTTSQNGGIRSPTWDSPPNRVHPGSFRSQGLLP